MCESSVGRTLSGQYFLEGFDQNVGIHTGGSIWVGVGPFLRSFEGVELGNHQAATEPCWARIVAVDGRMRAGQQQAAFLLQLLQASEMSGAGGQAIFQGVFDVGGDDGVEHLNPYLGSKRGGMKHLRHTAKACLRRMWGIITNINLNESAAMIVDLHCHSTASDGALAPAVLVARAHERGVRVLALTDHDTLEGLDEARRAATALDMRLINGIELSCTWGGATIHVLGYAFEREAPALRDAIEALHHGRWQRAEEIDRRLAAKGMPGALQGARAVQQELGDSGNAPARPHFAEFLVRAGHVRDRAEAFRKWLGSGKLGDVKQHWPTLEETLATLRSARAWISLAHPWQYDFTRSKRRRLVADFAAAGGHALEVVNGMQPAEQVGGLAILAREFGLMASVGSDFHAPGDWSELGMYRPLPDDLTALWERFEHAQPSAVTS